MNIREFFKNTKVWLGLIMLMAVFFRVYNFNEFLLFKADQARDAFIAKDVLERGVGYLPLLGPKAGDRVDLDHDNKSNEPDESSFKLGAIYYYIQIIPVVLLGTAQPYALALADLILSLASVLLLFFLFKQFFSEKISLAGTAIFASSYFFIQYSHFAWNTNQIIFWQFLFALSLVKTVESASLQGKKAGYWLISALASLSICTQLHLIAFFSYPLIAAVFWWIYRPNVSWKYWLAGIGLALMLYTPMLAYELKTNGLNTQRLVGAFDQEGKREEVKGEKKNSKIFYAIKHAGRAYVFSLSSLGSDEMDSVTTIGIIFVGISFFSLIFVFFKKLPTDSQSLKIRPYVILCLIWFIATGIVYVQVAYRLDKHRYWLLSGILPYSFFVFWLYYLEKRLSWAKRDIFLYALVSGLVLLNITADIAFFISLKQSKLNYFANRDIPLGVYNDFVTLGQMQRSVQYMGQVAKRENKKICFYNNDYQQRLAYEYLANFHFPNAVGKRINFDEDTPQQCTFFIVQKNKDKMSEIRKNFTDKFSIKGQYQDYMTKVLWIDFDQQVFQEKAKQELTENEKQIINDDAKDEEPIYWKDLF